MAVMRPFRGSQYFQAVIRAPPLAIASPFRVDGISFFLSPAVRQVAKGKRAVFSHLLIFFSSLDEKGGKNLVDALVFFFFTARHSYVHSVSNTFFLGKSLRTGRERYSLREEKEIKKIDSHT